MNTATNFKRISSLFLLFFLFSGLSSVQASGLVLTPSKNAVAPGETVYLDIGIDEARDIAGCAFTLRYPERILNLVDTPVVSSFFKTVNDLRANANPAAITPWESNTGIPGMVALAGAYINTNAATGGGGAYAGQQTLFRVSFQVKSDAAAGEYRFELLQTRLCNASAGWGTDNNGNGQCDAGDTGEGVPMLVKAFPKGSLQWNTPTLSDDFAVDVDRPTLNPKVPIVVMANATDTDGDGMPDGWEQKFGLNTGVNDAAKDNDGDGLTNAQEFAHGTRPDRADTDGDGIPDKWEVEHDLNPLVDDSREDKNGDGISNRDEYLQSIGVTISGRVISAATGEGLEGIWVDANSRFADFSDGKMTDADGFYHISVKRAPDYRVQALSQTYQPQFYNNVTVWYQADLIDVTAGPAENIDFVLQGGLAISGNVIGLTAGASAYIEAWSEQTNAWGVTSTIAVDTNPTAYEITGLTPASDYLLRVWADGFRMGYRQKDGSVGPFDTAEPVSAGSNSVDITLTSGKSISGTLSGMAAGDRAWISAASDLTGSFGGTEVESADGGATAYTITDLATTTDYVIGVWADGYRPGFYGGTSTLVPFFQKTLVSTAEGNVTNINMDMSSGRSISGTITGLASGDIAFVQAWNDKVFSGGIALVTGGGTDTAYTIGGLDPADGYFVFIEAPGYKGGFYGESGMTGRDEAKEINLTSASATNINFTLTSGTSISGIISGLNTGETAWLDAWSEAKRSWGGTAILGAGGDTPYTITGLEASTDYRVSFRPQDHIPDEKENIDSTNSPTNINFIALTGRTLSGTVENAKTGVVHVYIWNATLGDDFHLLVKPGSGVTSWSISGLPPSPGYQVWARSGNIHRKYNTTIDLTNGDSLGAVAFNFDETTYTLSGKITGLTGSTLVHINVWKVDTGFTAWQDLNGNGTYSFTLPSDDYNVEITAAGSATLYYTGSGWSTDYTKAVPKSLNQNATLEDASPATAYSISGTVYIDADNNGTGDANEKARDIFVEASSATIHAGDFTNGAGQFDIPGLPNGTYTVQVWSYLDTYTQSVTIATANPDSLTVVLSAKGGTNGSITGIVKKNSTAVGDAVVMLFKTGDSSDLVNAVNTGTDGSYSFGGLDAGNYKIKVDIEGDGTFEDTSGSLPVAAGAESTHDVNL